MRPPSDSNATGKLLFRSVLPPVSRFSLSFAFLVIAGVAYSQGPSRSLSALPRLTSLPEPSTTSISRGIKDVFAKSAKAVVKVRGTDELGDFAGTGFFIDPVGTLYTAYSVA